MLGLTPAVRIDLANILADHGHADKAEHWLTRHNINDPTILDTLAATYVEVGNERDAWTINRRAIDTDSKASHATQCLRLVRQIVLGPEGERLLPQTELERLATKPKVPDETCVRLHESIRCWSDPANKCLAHFINANVDRKYQYLLKAYLSWPSGSAAEPTWLRINSSAVDAVPLPGAAELTMTALEMAIAAARKCSDATAQHVNYAKRAMDLRLGSTPSRMTALSDSCPRLLKP